MALDLKILRNNRSPLDRASEAAPVDDEPVTDEEREARVRAAIDRVMSDPDNAAVLNDLAKQ